MFNLDWFCLRLSYPGSAAAEEAFNLVVVVNRTPTEIESHGPETFLACFCPWLSLNISQKRYPRTETHMLWHMSSNFYFNVTDSWPLVSVSRRRCWWSGGWAAGCRGGSCSGRSSTASSCCTAAPPSPAPPDCLNQTCKQWLTMLCSSGDWRVK